MVSLSPLVPPPCLLFFFPLIWPTLGLHSPGSLLFEPTIEQLKPTHPLQDDDASLPPEAKRRRTDTSGDGDVAYEVVGATPVTYESHHHTPNAAFFHVRSNTASVAGLDVERDPVKEELADIHLPTTQASSAENVAEAISSLLDQTRRMEDVTKQVSSAESSNAAFLKANSNLKSQSLPILDNLVSVA